MAPVLLSIVLCLQRVIHQVALPSERSTAITALEWPDAGVNSHVGAAVGPLIEAAATYATLKRPDAGVNSHVVLDIRPLVETVSTLSALERLLSAMEAAVPFQAAQSREGFAAVGTLDWL